MEFGNKYQQTIIIIVHFLLMVNLDIGGSIRMMVIQKLITVMIGGLKMVI